MLLYSYAIVTDASYLCAKLENSVVLIFCAAFCTSLVFFTNYFLNTINSIRVHSVLLSYTVQLRLITANIVVSGCSNNTVVTRAHAISIKNSASFMFVFEQLLANALDRFHTTVLALP